MFDAVCYVHSHEIMECLEFIYVIIDQSFANTINIFVNFKVWWNQWNEICNTYKHTNNNTSVLVFGWYDFLWLMLYDGNTSAEEIYSNSAAIYKKKSNK